MTKRKEVIYVGGLFEDRNSSLFQSIKLSMEELGKTCIFVPSCSISSLNSSSIHLEIQRVYDFIKKIEPEAIIAHSLGAYCVLSLQTNCNLILLDPSMPISEVILPNIKGRHYNDGNTTAAISDEFIESIKECPTIEEISRNIKNTERIIIVGAENGGHRIAEHYHDTLRSSKYHFLKNADHWFSDFNEQVASVIKNGLAL